MNNNKFDYLIPEISKILIETFMQALSVKKEFRQDEDVDTSPLLNMTIAVFLSSLINMLDIIKNYTDGEERLITNIELAKSSLIKAIEDLHFVSKVEFV